MYPIFLISKVPQPMVHIVNLIFVLNSCTQVNRDVDQKGFILHWKLMKKLPPYNHIFNVLHKIKADQHLRRISVYWVNFILKIHNIILRTVCFKFLDFHIVLILKNKNDQLKNIAFNNLPQYRSLLVSIQPRKLQKRQTDPFPHS